MALIDVAKKLLFLIIVIAQLWAFLVILEQLVTVGIYLFLD
jgi:hypothetical protein